MLGQWMSITTDVAAESLFKVKKLAPQKRAKINYFSVLKKLYKCVCRVMLDYDASTTDDHAYDALERSNDEDGDEFETEKNF